VQDSNRASARETREGGTGREAIGAADVSRMIRRIAHEIVERNGTEGPLLIVGLQRGGAWMAEELGRLVAAIEPEMSAEVALLDVSMHRDDFAIRPLATASTSTMPSDVGGRAVVLVDDVLYTGRTVRAALEAMNAYGRPRNIQLAVLVDRGHRELPIRPDYVGKNVSTHPLDDVEAGPDGVVVRGGDR
jgi:pyrimidine operon attenuation protein/uracil phosphoribosyltransferase